MPIEKCWLHETMFKILSVIYEDCKAQGFSQRPIQYFMLLCGIGEDHAYRLMKRLKDEQRIETQDCGQHPSKRLITSVGKMSFEAEMPEQNAGTNESIPYIDLSELKEQEDLKILKQEQTCGLNPEDTLNEQFNSLPYPIETKLEMAVMYKTAQIPYKNRFKTMARCVWAIAQNGVRNPVSYLKTAFLNELRKVITFTDIYMEHFA